jgi:lipoyl-dependent peroxiredoxin
VPVTATASFSRAAVLAWTGDVARGSGRVAAASEAFSVDATFPRVSGEPAGATTPEELLAASHAVCFGIALRSVLAQRGGTASQVRVTATVTAGKGGGLIRIQSAHLDGVVHGLAGAGPAALDEIARAAEEACTISAVLRPTVPVTVRVRAE